MPYESKWNAPFSYVDEIKPDQQDQRSRLKYGIINDDQYVYITLKTKDPSTIQNILSSGLKIAFSPEGQRKESYALTFPVVAKEDRKALKGLKQTFQTAWDSIYCWILTTKRLSGKIRKAGI